MQPAQCQAHSVHLTIWIQKGKIIWGQAALHFASNPKVLECFLSEVMPSRTSLEKRKTAPDPGGFKCTSPQPTISVPSSSPPRRSSSSLLTCRFCWVPWRLASARRVPLWIQETQQGKALWWLRPISKATISPGCLGNWIPFLDVEFSFLMSCIWERETETAPYPGPYDTPRWWSQPDTLPPFSFCIAFLGFQNHATLSDPKSMNGPGDIGRTVLTQMTPLAEGCLGLQLSQPKVIHRLLEATDAEFKRFCFCFLAFWLNTVELLWE